MKMTQNRFKSKVFWTALIAQLISIMGYLGLWEKWGIMPGQVETVVASVLQVLVLFGILNNPTDSENF
jgi:uncharacterized membrane protein